MSFKGNRLQRISEVWLYLMNIFTVRFKIEVYEWNKKITYRKKLMGYIKIFIFLIKISLVL